MVPYRWLGAIAGSALAIRAARGGIRSTSLTKRKRHERRLLLWFDRSMSPLDRQQPPGKARRSTKAAG